MADGYPMFDNKGANNIVTLRVPRFTSTAYYDPTIEPGHDAASRGLEVSILAICAALTSIIRSAITDAP